MPNISDVFNSYQPENTPAQDPTAPSSPVAQAFDSYGKEQEQPAAQSSSSSWQTFMDNVTAFNHAFEISGATTIKRILPFLEKTVAPTGTPQKEFDQTPSINQYTLQKQQELEQAQQNSPASTPWSQLLGSTGNAMAKYAVAMAPASVAGRTAAMAGMVGADKAIDAPEGNKISAGLSGLAEGAISNLIGEGASKLIQSLPLSNVGTSSYLKKIINPTAAAQEDLAYNIKNAANEVGGVAGALERAAAAKRLKVPLGTEEAFGYIPQNEEATSLQKLAANVSSSPTVREDIGQMIGNRAGNLKAQVQNTIDSILPDGLKKSQATSEELRAVLSKSEIKPEVYTTSIESNPILKKELSDITADQTSSIRNLPDTNFQKLDALKRNLDDKIYGNNPLLGHDTSNTLSSQQLSDYKQARNLLVNTLDQQGAELGIPYAEARNLSQRIKFTNDINEALTKNTSGGQISLKDYYNTLFGNGEKQERFLDAIESAGGDQTKTKDIINLLDGIIKNSKSAQNLKIDMHSGFISNTFAKTLQPENYKEALASLLINPDKWTPIVENLAKHPTAETLKESIKSIISSNTASTGVGVLSRRYGILPALMYNDQTRSTDH